MRPVPLPARRAFFWLLLLAVAVGSLLPADYLPPQAFDLWDKAQHALGFLALALAGTWAHPRRNAWQTVGLATGLLAFGAAIEIAQAFTGWRQGDGLDLLADAIGLAAGLALAPIACGLRLATK
jgi:VanZ family protein